MRSELVCCHSSEPFMGVLAITLRVVLAIGVGVDLLVLGHLNTAWFVVGEVGPFVRQLNDVAFCLYLSDFCF